MQLDLPMMVGRSIPVLYIPFDGTGVPVVKKETVGRQGNREGQSQDHAVEHLEFLKIRRQ
jgi:hypothetical protein